MDIIDRRLNPKGRSLGNRQRFIRRARAEIREAVKRGLRDRSVSDAQSGESITIPSESIHEPHFVHDPETGQRERVLPGNKEFVEGDRIPKPPAGRGGTGGGPSDQGEGEDEFAFTLTREEFLDLLFEDLELPDLSKRKIKSEQSLKLERAGYSTTGPANRLNLVRTMRQSMVRRIALGRPSGDMVAEMEAELERLKSGEIQPADGTSAEARIAELEKELEKARQKRATIAYIDPVDLRYNRYEHVPKPVTQAVMFCLMDVSASMDESMKELAKRFFMLLHLFLERRYENIEVVFIRHTNRAAEVDEETFFYGRATGGTVVSSAFHEMLRVVGERYPLDDWNVYVAQASDGEDMPDDVGICAKLLEQEVLPMCQYMAYVEVGGALARRPGFKLHRQSDLWTGYEPVAQAHRNFGMRRISEPRDIYPVFHGLFSRKGEEA